MPDRVQLFITCIADTFFPKVGEAVLQVLQRCGVAVDFPVGQTCCGQPAYNAGLRPQARQMAEQTIRVFATEQDPVVLPSGSCAAMIHHGYPELFAGDPDWELRARELAGRTYEFSQFLVDVLQVDDLGAQSAGRLTYHPSCHLSRELGVRRQPLELLSHVTGAELVALPQAEECCGFGGVFSTEHVDISAAMLERKLAAIQSSGADTLVTCDSGCLMHIYGGLLKQGRPQRVLHLAEILAQTGPRQVDKGLGAEKR